MSSTAKPPDPVRIAVPGIYHGPLEGHVLAGHTVLANGIPTVYLDLGMIAGRLVTLSVTDLLWLSDLGYAVQVAQARLSMWEADHPACAA